MTADVAIGRPKAPLWLTFTVAGLFGLLYAWCVWTAVTLLVNLASLADLNATAWVLFIGAVLLPALIYAGAFALGWKRRIGDLAVILLAGLALVAVFWMNVLGYASTNLANLLA